MDGGGDADLDLEARIRQWRERVESTAAEGRAILAQRGELLDSSNVVAVFAKDMSEFLRAGELTESKVPVRSFAKEVVVLPGGAAMIYTISTPDDIPMGGVDSAEIALSGGVRSIGYDGTPGGTRTPDARLRTPPLYPLSYRGRLVEIGGLEPPTSALRTPRSPS